MSSDTSLRPRRLRRGEAIRHLARETRLRADEFIYPLFVMHGRSRREPVESMPGIARLTVDEALLEVNRALELGIRAVLIFGLPRRKDPQGSRAWASVGPVQKAVRALKAEFPDLAVITDVCLCSYTDHGHCGLVSEGGDVLNDETLPLLGRIACSHAEAGADVVAPSGMMDHAVGALRSALDEARHGDVTIMSYTAKFASSFYGPFRDAADGAPQFGDRRAYQMDPANARDALREAAIDVEEGADFLMVKPALPYLDVIHRIKSAFPHLPLAAYNVSGEYSMVKAAATRGWCDERRSVLEILRSIRRAGADLVITYHALDAARWLSDV